MKLTVEEKNIKTVYTETTITEYRLDKKFNFKKSKEKKNDKPVVKHFKSYTSYLKRYKNNLGISLSVQGKELEILAFVHLDNDDKTYYIFAEFVDEKEANKYFNELKRELFPNRKTLPLKEKTFEELKLIS